MSKVAYLLAAYPGPRLNGDSNEYASDRTLFLRYHFEKLQSLEHDCDVYVIINEPNSYDPGVRALLNEIEQKYTVYYRPNIGCSYAAWNYAFHQQRQYDYYVLMEDDYVPVQHHFDTKLVNIIEQENAAYLCTQLGWGHGGGEFPHAGISNGIVNGNAVRAGLANGGFPHSNTIADYDHYTGTFGQVKFSQKFLSYGRMVDFINYYKAPYWHVDHLREFYDHNEETLIAPYQLAVKL